MGYRGRTLLAGAAALSLALTSGAVAHPEHGDGGGEQFPGEGVAGDKQHDGEDGHLDPVSEGVDLIGKGGVSAPAGTDGDMTGRVADVAAHEDHAYLTSFRSADCLGGGFWVMDISDPSAPTEVAFAPTTDGNYAGEGAQVIVPATGPYAGTPLFLHQNETCDATKAAADAARGGTDRFLGGIHIWDVSDPTDPQLVVEHAGDLTATDADGNEVARTNPTTVHSVYAWNSHHDGRTYAVLVDNQEWTDVDILDITDPTAPVMVNDTLDLVDLFGVDQASPENLTSVFNHDMMVTRKGERYVMNVNYWDGGYVLLDVTDPTPGNVTLIAETDYAELDEERLKRGHRISPEGNAHQSEFSPDHRFMIGTDEDFAPFRLTGAVVGGPSDGASIRAIPAGDAGQIEGGETVSGPLTFLGQACAVTSGTDIPDATTDDAIALIERGTCSFQEKLDAAQDAGYVAGVVFDNGCAMVNMLAAGDIPFLFVPRESGLQLLGAGPEASCHDALPADPQAQSVTFTSEFDGWGYVRLFRTDVPGEVGVPGSITQVDTYAVEESQDPAYATGFGDLSVHEVAMDPRPGVQLAYLSYYAAGLRVLSYGPKGLEEVGAFIDEGGNNFWGIEVHELDGETYVLASDRDHGLYVFQATPDRPGRPTTSRPRGPKG